MNAVTPLTLQPPAPQAARLRVTLLLEGGHRVPLELDADDAVLAQLRAALADTEHRQPPRLFELPLDGGRSLLSFSSRRLLGLHVEQGAGVAQALPGIERSRVLIIDNLFKPEIKQRLMEYALANEQRYVETTTATKEASYRESLVLHDFPEYAELMRKAIVQLLPQVKSQLNCAPLGERIETQLTTHNDGNYYKIHNDNGAAEIATRELTYVYYFHAHPKAFTGGDLKVYDTRVENNRYVAAETSQQIEPRDNRIVFFLSRYMHEVLPVVCPSQRFADGRFTINGWVHRQ